MSQTQKDLMSDWKKDIPIYRHCHDRNICFLLVHTASIFMLTETFLQKLLFEKAKSSYKLK